MESVVKSIILGILQGITEWLPISSTGHLRLAEHFLGLEVPFLFDVALHIGTLAVVLMFLRSEVWTTTSALFHRRFNSEDGKTALLVVAGVVPTFVIGLVFGSAIERLFAGPLPVAVALIACGVLLFSVKFTAERTSRIGYSAAVAIGVAQGLAIMPGISRSGATIVVALWLGINRRKAFTFSFLLSIPAVLGALGVTIYTESTEIAAAGLGLGEILAGVTAAMFVGYFALRLLRRIVVKQQLHLFAYYCWALGSLVILLSTALQ